MGWNRHMDKLEPNDTYKILVCRDCDLMDET